MANSVDQAFIKQFESEVKESYQRMGSKLRQTVRNKTNIIGKSTTFQKVGKGTAASKAGPGSDVPTMNVAHSNVECTLQDYYAGDWVDKFDELKTNIDERQVVSNAGAYALGRQTDSMIITALGTTTTVVGDYSTALTKNLISLALEALGNNDVPDDGNRFAALSMHAWQEFKNIAQVGSGDYTGELYPWMKGQQAFVWEGILWMPHSGLPLANTDDRDCFIWHKNAIGHASGADVSSDVSWHGDKASFFVNNMMSQGAVLIDASGIVKIKVDDDTALT